MSERPEREGDGGLTAEWVAYADELETQRDSLRELLLESKREHRVADDDSWGFCPKHPRVSFSPQLGNKCDCGADDWNAKVDAALVDIDG